MLLAAKPPKAVTGAQVQRWRRSRIDLRTGKPMTQEEASLVYAIHPRTWGRYEQGELEAPGWLALAVTHDLVPAGYRRAKGA